MGHGDSQTGNGAFLGPDSPVPALGRNPATFRLKWREFLPIVGPDSRHAMRRTALALASLLVLLIPGGASTQEAVVVSASSKPKAGSASLTTLKCHFSRKDRSFCRIFPNFSRRHDICDPAPLGHIEWCREDVTITERDDCGNYETYEAVTITYREVFENGAWGKKFQKTYRKEPSLITPPVLAKGVVK